MISRGVRAAAAFLLAASAPALALAPVTDAKTVANKSAAKTAAAPAIEPDPAVRFGTLPNGFRYAMMQNMSPAGSVSVRLLVKVGSHDETDDELGYAHFSG